VDEATVDRDPTDEDLLEEPDEPDEPDPDDPEDPDEPDPDEARPDEPDLSSPGSVWEPRSSPGSACEPRSSPGSACAPRSSPGSVRELRGVAPPLSSPASEVRAELGVPEGLLAVRALSSPSSVTSWADGGT
jgi:hypothetical protein